MQIILSQKQRVWRWPAVMNFTLGGAGAGFYLLGSLIICLQDFSGGESSLIAFKLVAPVLVMLGFISLASDVGRPMRFYHVFRNLATSWISRETLIAILFVFISLIEWFLHQQLLWIMAATGAISIMISQGLIVYRSRALPAWNVLFAPILFITSGFVSGCGIFLIFAALVAVQIVPLVALITFIIIIINFVIFLFYLFYIKDNTFREAIIELLRLGNLATSIGFFHLLPAMLLWPLTLHANIQNSAGIIRFIAIISGLIIFLGGLNLKVKIILGAGSFRKIILKDSKSED